jgi:hypothetical protein
MGQRLGEREREGREIRAWENRRYMILIDGLKRWRKDREHRCTAALTNYPFDQPYRLNRTFTYMGGTVDVQICTSTVPAMTWVHQ